jgi:hypothetical protein
MHLILPLFALTALFVFPAIIGLIAVLKWFRSRNRLYESIDHAIDKGASPEVIDQLIGLTKKEDDGEDKTPRKKRLTDGIMMLALGIAFIILYVMGINDTLIYPAAFLTLLGLGNLCVAAINLKDSSPDSE